MSATINRPSTSAAQEHTGLKFGCCYADTNEDFFSLPAKSSCGFMVQSQKVRPNFVHLIHSNSAPMVMSDEERGAVASGLGEKHSGGGGGGKKNIVLYIFTLHYSTVFVYTHTCTHTPHTN